MKFKRAFLMEPHRFEIHEVEEEPGPGEVMMKVASCGLCNWELNFWDGNLNFMGYPHKLGHEFAGTVVKLGPGCTKFKVGDKISAVARGFGGFAEYRATPEACCEKLADNIDPKYALGEPQKCILTVLRATAPQAADYGVVLGCGPMGMWCIQALAGNYLAGLIAIDVDDAKLEMAKGFGATATINSKNENVVERIRESRLAGNTHFMIVVAEGAGSAVEIGKKIHEAVGIDPRVTVLGHIQRGGSPTARDRETASRMGYAAVKAMAEGRTNCIIGTNEGHLVEIPIEEALAMTKHLQMERYDVLEAMHNQGGSD